MNTDITNNLGILARYYKKVNDQWRYQAYQRAIISIRGLDFEIIDIKQLKGVKGIGKSIMDKIKEYLDNGMIQKVEEIKKEIQTSAQINTRESILEKLQGIWGVGPTKAHELYTAGVRSINDVYDHLDLLTANQKVGLKYYEEFLKPIPRHDIDVFKIAVKVVLADEYGLDSFTMKVAGSYRRGADESGDVDILISSEKFTLENVVDTLLRWGIVTDILSVKKEKFMGVAQCPGNGHHFRLDIEFVPKDEFGACLLYFTGSKGFNVAMRMDAKRLGYTLNQHGLFTKQGHRVPVFTEKEIMETLGMAYVPPNKR